MSIGKTPIKNYQLYNKASIARSLGFSRVYISKVMRGLVKNDRLLDAIKKHIDQSRAA